MPWKTPWQPAVRAQQQLKTTHSLQSYLAGISDYMSPAPAGVPAANRKGKTLAEVEQEEGGPVKTSLKAMAHVKRAAQRKAKREWPQG
jgi:hypothetical protein